MHVCHEKGSRLRGIRMLRAIAPKDRKCAPSADPNGMDHVKAWKIEARREYPMKVEDALEENGWGDEM